MIFSFLLGSLLFKLASMPLILLLCWRFWRFTILPRFRPEEPNELPYWIPYVGHAISYFRDSFSVLTSGRMHFNDNREPFSITLAGQTVYILTGPADVTAAYRNTASLSMDVFLQDLMCGFEITPDGTRRVYEEQGKTNEVKILSDNPSGKSLVHLMVDWFRIQLSPGDNLNKLGQVTCDYFEEALRWENINDPLYVLSSSTENYKDISLYHFCEQLLLGAAVRSFFGDVLIEGSPNLHKDFLAFDEVSWKLLYQYPKAFSGDMHNAKDKIVDALEKYFALPLSSRPDANWFVRHQEAEMRALGVSPRDMARMIGLIYWVINTNAYKLLFWMTSYMLLDKTLVDNSRTELQACFNPDGSLNLPSLQTQSKYVTALFLETMRMSNSSASARFVTSDTQINQYVLRAGRRLLIPYRQLHLNTAVFGDNAAEFDINRFLDDPKLAKNPSYRPFGGGKSYCPGRFLAKQELLQVLAYLLTRFEVEIAPGAGDKFPRMDELKPGIGIVGPVQGDDLVVRIRPRKG
ncbi:cytochrome P450 [Amniculicola lignicola CBS 123094]|uniref:Cytochrome P450 n=1 Tax=Amniculicola lignicola CBS 123094 TaxID=1392246 RepID=A0A6A5W0N6_9PLEO|nr:cytochrome P450 [Amniculicola lignicola CBS 123094]